MDNVLPIGGVFELCLWMLGTSTRRPELGHLAGLHWARMITSTPRSRRRSVLLRCGPPRAASPHAYGLRGWRIRRQFFVLVVGRHDSDRSLSGIRGAR